ncbi:hypothetical protein Tco_0539485 [Tanacetum coccineum]
MRYASLAGHPVKKILQNIYLITGILYTDQNGEPWLIANRIRRSDKDTFRQSVKVKELQDKRILKAFKLSYQEKYEHVGPKSQDHKIARLQDDDKRLCLVDDLKKFKITFYLVKDTSQSLKSKITTTYHKFMIEV